MQTLLSLLLITFVILFLHGFTQGLSNNSKKKKLNKEEDVHVNEDAMQALIKLGYKKSIVLPILKELNQNMSTSDLIRETMKKLTK